MSKHVSKHCSILNYIRQHDEQLYKLIEELCLGRIFVPRKGSNGITFLRPNKKLVDELYDLDEKGDTERVAECIRAMVLLDYIPNIRSFDSQDEPIITSSKKILPVKSVSNGKVTLKNGAIVELDENFKHRDDRNNIAVYHISGPLLDPSSLESTQLNVKPRVRVMKGGAEYGDDKSKLFNTVLDAYFADGIQDNRDPALETLVSLMSFLAETNETNVLDVVKSQLSSDTLTTLAIVLQPHKKSGVKYISDELYAKWKNQYGSAECKDIIDFSYMSNPVKYYMDMMDKNKYSGEISALKELADEKLSESDKPSIISNLTKYYSSISNMNGLPNLRKGLSKNEMIAESELRVLGFILNQNDGSIDEARTLFNVNCKLDNPYLCTTDIVGKMSLGVFYSTAYLIIRSDALFYLPGYGDQWKPIDSNIGNPNAMFSLERSISYSLEKKLSFDSNYYKTKQEMFEKLLKKIMNI
jgi:hypothetical protein